MMKNKGELPLEGSSNDVKARLERAFDMLMTQSINSSKSDESYTKNVEVRTAIETLQQIASTYERKEAEMVEEEAALSKKAHSLQIAFAETAARKDKEYELSKQPMGTASPEK